MQVEQDPGRERGQTTVLLAVVLAAGFGLALVLATLGRAAIDRANARTAADAVALAAVVEPDSSEGLLRWYGEAGIVVDIHSDRVSARIGASQAASWAEPAAEPVVGAPAVVAIVARAGDLTGNRLTPLRIVGTSVWLSPDQAALFASVSRALGMCAVDSTSAIGHYTLC